MASKSLTCVFDLDGTLNHAEYVAGSLPVKGRTADSFISPETLERLKMLCHVADIFVATGRAKLSIKDFQTHFAKAGINICAWILEHGALISGNPEWTKKVLKDINLNDVWSKVDQIIDKYNLPIDYNYYRHDHEAIILLSGKGQVLAEYFIDRMSGFLDNRFRFIAGKRKIALIPKSGDKFKAFSANFTNSHFLTFAAGDQPDDLSILQNCTFPLTSAGASPIVQEYVKSRKGFVSKQKSHKGSVQILDKILECINFQSFKNICVCSRIPKEQTKYFRTSRRNYLDLLFAHCKMPCEIPDAGFLEQTAKKLNYGKNIIIEIRMRDWGGEVKPLLALIHALVPLLIYAKWKLVFRPERLGIENLKSFNSITQKLKQFIKLPDGSIRFSAPGVPYSSPDPGKSSIVLLMYDYPEDMSPWYDLAITRLVTRFPEKKHTWFVNPMFLKISGACQQNLEKNKISKIFPENFKIMMAANLIGTTDINIAVQGFNKLKQLGLIDAMIIAPRVVSNPERNKMIKSSIISIDQKFLYLSKLKNNKLKPENNVRIVFVDTYGDLYSLYRFCKITYLGGGFNPRKRGFDPVESLCAHVPVISGPLYDYNRIAVEALLNTGWINILESKKKSINDFINIAVKVLKKDIPCPEKLDQFFHKRSLDPLRASAEIMADLTGDTKNGYLFSENTVFSRDKIKISQLMPDNFLEEPL